MKITSIFVTFLENMNFIYVNIFYEILNTIDSYSDKFEASIFKTYDLIQIYRIIIY